MAQATGIIVEGSIFRGGCSPVAFNGCRDAIFRYNTVYLPRMWLIRILRENFREGMLDTGHNRIERNVFVHDRSTLRQIINVSRGTAPDTFTFHQNLWYAVDAPEQSLPDLPAEATEPVVGRDPEFADPDQGDLTPKTDTSPAADYGAAALPADLADYSPIREPERGRRR